MGDTRKILEIGNSSELSTLRARIGELEAENAGLRTALEPFATLADGGGRGDGMIAVPVDHCRRAQKALSSEREG